MSMTCGCHVIDAIDVIDVIDSVVVVLMFELTHISLGKGSTIRIIHHSNIMSIVRTAETIDTRGQV